MIRRISAHGGGTTQIGAEDLGQNHRYRVKLKKLCQFNGNRCQKQNYRDAVNKHGKNKGHQHKGNKQRNGPVMDRFG